MWHPFDLMPQELTVPDAVRNASAGDRCRLVYGERITRWFKDKASTDQQWPPTVDKKPGLTLARQPGPAGTFDLDVRQTWVLTNTQTMTGKMTCRAEGWRSPLTWEFRQTFLNDKGKPLVPGLTESGRWKNGILERSTKGDHGEVRQTVRATELASVYALIANFPKEGEAAGSTGLLREALTYSPDAAWQPAPKVLQESPLARGLRGYVLKSEGGFPADCWVNAAGVVVYVCYGPNRAFVLDQVEALA